MSCTAYILMDGVLTPNENLSIGSQVTLTNQDNTGVTTWAWTLVSKPTGSSASISSATSATAYFTPDLEGAYLVRLIVNASLVTEEQGTSVGRVKTLHKELLPHAKDETSEGDATEGWAKAWRETYLKLDKALGIPSDRRTVRYAGSAASGPVLLVPDGTMYTMSNGDVVPSVRLATAADNKQAMFLYEYGALAQGVVTVLEHGLSVSMTLAGVSTGDEIYATTNGAIVNASVAYMHRPVGYCVYASGGSARVWFNPTSYTLIDTIDHERLQGLLGGTTNAHYHLNANQYGAVNSSSFPSASNVFITNSALTTRLSSYVPTTRQVIAGTGMTGGGALSANVTLTNNGVLTVNSQKGTLTIQGEAGGIGVGTSGTTITISNLGVKSVSGTSGRIDAITSSGGVLLDLSTVAGLATGTYGGSTNVPVLTVDAYGRITAVSNQSITYGTGSVTSVAVSTGTTGLTVSGGTSQTITTSGTFTIGGTLVAANGGTGQSAYVVGDLLYASTTSALSRLADVATGNVLISGGIGVAPSWNKVGLTTHITGTLPVANGGTGQATAPTSGQILIGTSSGAYSNNTITQGTGIQVTSGSGSITIANTGVTSISVSAPILSSGGTTPALSLGTVDVANGGTGATTLTSNGVLLGNGTSAVSAVAPGASGYVLTSNGTSSAPTWQIGPVTGSGANTQIAFWNSTSALSGSGSLTWDNASSRLAISGAVGVGTTGLGPLASGMLAASSSVYVGTPTTISTWTASTAYSVGTTVMTSTRAVYTCIRAGTSGVVEPTGTGFITDGATLRWRFENFSQFSNSNIEIGRNGSPTTGADGTAFLDLHGSSYVSATDYALRLIRGSDNTSLLDSVGDTPLTIRAASGAMQRLTFSGYTSGSLTGTVTATGGRSARIIQAVLSGSTGTLFVDTVVISTGWNGLALTVDGGAVALTATSDITTGTGGRIVVAAYDSIRMTTNSTERLSVISNGNVGVGIASPAARLHVYEPTLAAHSITWGASAAATIRNEAGELAIGHNNVSPYNFWLQGRTNSSSTKDIALQPSGGKVSVGTIDALKRFNVNGQIGMPNGNAICFTDGTQNAYIADVAVYNYYQPFVAGSGGIGPVTNVGGGGTPDTPENDVLLLQASGNADGIISLRAGPAAQYRDPQMVISGGGVGITGDLYVGGDSDVTGNSNVDGNSNVGGDLYVGGDSTTDGTVTTYGGVIYPDNELQTFSASRSYTPKNYIINGNFDFWQRTGSSLLINTETGGSTARFFVPDRWYIAVSGNAGVITVSNDTTITNGVNGCTVARSVADNAISSRYLVQEIDRDYVKLLRGRMVRLTFTYKTGVTFNGTLFAEIIYNSNASLSQTSQAFNSPWVTTAYTSPVTALSKKVQDNAVTSSWTQESYVTSAVIPTGATNMCVRFKHTPTSTTSASNSFSVSAVMLTDAGAGTVSLPEPSAPYIYSGGSYSGELIECQRYYEKSYAIDTSPGNTSDGGFERGMSINLATANQAAWPITAHPRFKVTKRVAPSIVNVYGYLDGTAGKWYVAGNYASVAAFVTQQSFSVVNNTGASQTPAVGYSLGHWTADAEI